MHINNTVYWFRCKDSLFFWFNQTILYLFNRNYCRKAKIMSRQGLASHWYIPRRFVFAVCARTRLSMSLRWRPVSIHLRSRSRMSKRKLNTKKQIQMTPVDNIYGRKVYKVGSIVTSARRQRILEIRASKKYANINSQVSKHKWQSMFRYLARYV